MEINSGPVSRDKHYLKQFYQELQSYAKENGALELLVKPYDTYQHFDTTGQPTDQENTALLDDFLSLGYQHDGLLTGYPGGEPDWHYVKDLTDLDEKTLLKSFSKKGRPLVKKLRPSASPYENLTVMNCRFSRKSLLLHQIAEITMINLLIITKISMIALEILVNSWLQV